MNQRAYAQRRARERARFAWVGGYKLRPGRRYHVGVLLHGTVGWAGSFVAERGVYNPVLEASF